MKKYLLLISIFIIAFFAMSFYQLNDDLVDRLDKMLFAYNQEHPTTNLFVHLDKNIYMPGETIWFKAYLPSHSQLQSEGLYIRLVNEAKQIVLEKEFIVYDIRSHGDIILPDTLAQGTINYIHIPTK